MKGLIELPFSVIVTANKKFYIVKRFPNREKANAYCDLIILIANITAVSPEIKIFNESQLETTMQGELNLCP